MHWLLDRLRFMPAGRRLLLCLVAGALFFAAPFPPRDVAVHAGAAWVFGVLLFLLLTAVSVHNITTAELRRRSRELDDRAWVISMLVVIAAGISLTALAIIIYGQDRAPDEVVVWRLTVGAAGMVCAWFLIHTVLALHYAHRYYGDDHGEAKARDRGGLDFPGKEEPDYWDFCYYAFVIGMTCQVSDVDAASRGMRRLTLVHSVIAFFFNTTVIALTVNLIASRHG